MALDMINFFQAILSARFCVYRGKIIYTFHTQMVKGWKILDTLFSPNPNCSKIFTQHSLGPLNHSYLKYGLSAEGQYVLSQQDETNCNNLL